MDPIPDPKSKTFGHHISEFGPVVEMHDHSIDFPQGVNSDDPDYDYQGPPTQLMKAKSPRPSRRHPRKAK